MKKFKIILLLSILLGCITLTAQQNDNENIKKAHIQLKVGEFPEKIALRWAVDEPIAWQKANKIGFVLKRHTILRDGKMLPKSELKELGVFQIAPPNEWEKIIEENDNAAIVAQALYGESFEVEMGTTQGDLQGIINKSQEIEQRFAFALMAADLDFTIATLAGWGYVDTTAKTNERYLYTVELNSANNPKNVQVENGSAIAEISTIKKLPKPFDFIGIFEDKKVTLAWDYKQLSDTYTTYFIEKAVGNTDFTPLGNLPVMQMSPDAPGMLYIDSLKQNDIECRYRIRGKTIFGNFGPYSEIISGVGKNGLKYSPKITNYKITKDETISIQWEYPKEAEKDIIGFELLHSETDRENSYKTITENIAPAQRKITTKSLAPSNYYKIAVVGKNHTKRSSFSVLIQPNDTIPPSAPKALEGKIDSLGIAHLKWQPNTEKDLEGYHIFRADVKGKELVRVTPQAITNNYFQDSVQITNLGDKVYYYVTATDIRKNQSVPSKILELSKPDVIKPQPPTFSDYKIEEGTITLKWIKSYSSDVVKHQLYRIDLEEEKPIAKVVFETQKIQPNYSYTDEDIEAGKRYRYYLIAIDKSNLLSEKSQEITLRNTNLSATKVIRSLSSFVNKEKKQIELFWKVNKKEKVTEIVVYRQKQGEKPTLWGTLPGGQNFLEDTNIIPANTYTYFIKAMLSNQKPTTTQKITVTY